MPVANFMRVIDEITPHVNPNKTMIIFTGGEALLRKDLEICGKELYDRGFPWGLVSNGMALTPQRLQSLLASGLHSITISFDGFEEAHNWLRENHKSYANALNAIKMLTKVKNIVWDVVTCVNKKNISDLNAFKEFLIETGVKDWRKFTIFPLGVQPNRLNFSFRMQNSLRYSILFAKTERKTASFKLRLRRFSGKI